MINMIPDTKTPSLAEKNGYLFQIFTSVDIDDYSSKQDQETFAVVCWPKKYNKTGNACYAITEDGTIYRYANEQGHFDGHDKPILIEDLYGEYFNADSIGGGYTKFVSAK